MYELFMMYENQQQVSLQAYANEVVKNYQLLLEKQRSSEKLDIEIPEITVEEKSFDVAFKTLIFTIHQSCEDWVLVESKEIADEFAKGNPNQAAIAKCDCRFELSTKGYDLDMNYFNDYIDMQEALEKFGTFWFFDLESTRFN